MALMANILCYVIMAMISNLNVFVMQAMNDIEMQNCKCLRCKGLEDHGVLLNAKVRGVLYFLSMYPRGVNFPMSLI